MIIAYINGEFLPLDQVKISAMDRGFLFGDGVYEVIPVFNSKLFRLSQHLVRLQRSLTSIDLFLEHTQDQWTELLTQLIKQNPGHPDQAVYLQVTRGPIATREHIFPVNPQPTIFAYCYPLQSKSVEELAQGISAITLQDIRWKRCDVKAITLLGNVLLRQQADDANAQEAILINGNRAIELTISNLFIVKDNCLITPPLGIEILGGVTRDLVIELALQYNIKLEQRDILVPELLEADEIWATSSTKEITPILSLDGTPINGGKAGPMWRQMIAYYQAYKREFRG